MPGTGARPKCCSACKNPVNGHDGPTGRTCKHVSPEKANVEINEESSSGDEVTDQNSVLRLLVNQMAALNVNLEAMRTGQKELQKTVQTMNVGKPRDASETGNASQHGDKAQGGQQGANYADAAVHETKHIALEFGGSITERTSKSAINGEFANLSDFLPAITPSVTDMETAVSTGGSIYVRPRRPHRAIDSFHTWLNAWSNYEALILSKQPTLYRNFAHYRSFIQSCDNKYVWHAVYAYDCRFRAQLANNKSWELQKSHMDIYITTFDTTTVKRSLKQCYRCKSPGHAIAECPFPASSSLEENKKKTPSLRRDKWFHLGNEGCNNFQVGRCTDVNCKRAHVCKSCRGPEPFQRCTKCH